MEGGGTDVGAHFSSINMRVCFLNFPFSFHMFHSFWYFSFFSSFSSATFPPPLIPISNMTTAYALGRSPSSPLIRVDPVQLRARTLADLGGSFCIGQCSPSPNTPATYRMRSFPYRTFRQSRLDDVFYADNFLHTSPQYRPFPLIGNYDRRDHKSVPYTYWSRGKMDCLYGSDQPDNYRRTYEPYRDDYSCKVWSASRRLLLQGLI